MDVDQPERAHIESRRQALEDRTILPLCVDVAREHGATIDEILSSERGTKRVIYARWAVWSALRNHPRHVFSLADIGNLFGRSTSAVHLGVRLHEEQLAADASRQAAAS